MTNSVNPLLILDSNIWVSERMLHTALGAATLHALTKSGGQIGLPEIVELEVNRVLLEQADKAVDDLQKSAQFLRQVTGHQLTVIALSQHAVKEALDERWERLSGVLHRFPFILEHARAALMRIIDKKPPCGHNNEQFRDCCIWQCALEQATYNPVHLVTSDLAFYEGRNRGSGLTKVLAAELKELNREVHLHPHLNSFLGSMDSTMRSIDEAAIGAAIEEAVTPWAQEKVMEDSDEFELGSVRDLKITGYATPKTSVIAVSFSLSFNMSLGKLQSGEERNTKGRLGIVGGCSYNPNTKVVSDMEISQWSRSADPESGMSWGKYYSSGDDFSKVFSEGRYRVV